MQFIKNIQNFSFQNKLWQKGSKIVLGVSGGPDSICMLDVFANLAKKYDLKLHIAHVNYGIRLEESDLDEDFTKEAAKKYGIGISILRPDSKTYKGNLENSLRGIRYDFFEKTRTELKYDFIAVAHNQDDQVETILMRLLRGSGLRGLSAMNARNGFIIRPLLNTKRIEIETYLEKKNILWRIDKSNLDQNFTRNKIRHELVPYLEEKFNPSLKTTLANSAATISDDYIFIENEISKIFDGFMHADKQKISFNCKDFLKYDDHVARSLLRRSMQILRSDLLDIEKTHIDEILKIVKSNKNKSQKSSFKGLNVSKNGDIVELFCI